MAKFTHLHVHSHYSLLDGLAKIDELVRRAAELEMGALALTDHGNLYGAIEFYQKAKKAGVKPILGAEMYLAFERMQDKRPNLDNKRFHLTVLATNREGYKNLMKLVTKSHLDGFYYKPRIDKELLREYSTGLVALSGCFAAEIPRAIHNKKMDQAEKTVREYQDIFGKDNFYLELGSHFNYPDQKAINAGLEYLSQKTGARLAATNDVHYVHPGDAEAQDILVSIQTGSSLEDEDRLTMKGADLSMRSAQNMAALFPDHPEAMAATQDIASQVNIELEFGNWTFPELKLPADLNPDEELRRITYQGLPSRGLQKTKEVADRLEYELDVIREKKFAPYFLVVSDIIDFAHRKGILTNVRGSVAGSLVTYLTGITSINPLEYKLPFERFLNRERPSPPDIDMDFADDRRDEVIQYVKDKYGEERVAQIGTFGTMMARAVVRDVARALKYPYAVGDRIAKLIPLGSQGFPMTIDQALKITPELRKIYENEPEIRRIVDEAQKLEGGARHISVHAAGVVIAPRPLLEYVPLQQDPKGGKIITQYDMHAVESVGLLKFDFLGIRNLAILADSVRLVKEQHNLDIDIESLPLDDHKTFELLSRGETMGLFQLGGSGMTKYLKDLRPTSIHDINAMVALYRPGPIESIPEYIRRKHNPVLVSYLDPRMQEILDQSYGVITYQDDVLLIAIKLAGYSWLEADKLRKAMGKKIPEEMEAQKEKLIQGLISNGMSGTKAQELWKLIEPFAAYGFNAAHAASYGRVAYQTAYMKANFPAEYMTAVLTADSGDMEKVAEIITECNRMGIPVLPPDVNESYARFTLIRGNDAEKDKIRFGLESVKNVGANIVQAIVAARRDEPSPRLLGEAGRPDSELGRAAPKEASLAPKGRETRKLGGKFTSIVDFAERVHHKDFNKKSLESLIKCGALDDLGERNQMLANLDLILEYNRESQKASMGGQTDLFSLTPEIRITSLRLKGAEPATRKERLTWEKELLGLYITEHPIQEYMEKLQANRILTIKDVQSLGRHPSTLAVGGMVSGIQKIITKSGEPMLFVKLEDTQARIEVLVFPKVLSRNPGLWQKEKVLVVRGRLSDKDDRPKILCEEAIEIA